MNALGAVTLAPLLCSIAAAQDGGDAGGARNVAATSTLPRGDGLAARFVADRGIATDEAVVFACDFEGPDWREQFGEVRDDERAVLSIGSPGAPALGERCLVVTATLGANTGGGVTKWFEPSAGIFVRFYVRFAADCDYVHHFVTLRANRGLRGGDRWSGFGGAGVRPEGDERFSTALEPWGDWGRWPAPGRWNFYSYWHEMTASPDGRFWGNAFRPADGDPLATPIPKDRWICAEFWLKENTPGERDGEQAFWTDGALVGHWQGIGWREAPELHANALTLESYVTDRWTKHAVNVVSFDNLVIARSYIGPSKAPAAGSDIRRPKPDGRKAPTRAVQPRRA